jgi:hypothetical protein
MNAAAREDVRSDAPLQAFLGGQRVACDRDATLSSLLAFVACLGIGVSWLVGVYLRAASWSSALGIGLLILSPLVGFYACLFAIGALSNRTQHRSRAWFGLIAGAIPGVLFVWLLNAAAST